MKRTSPREKRTTPRATPRTTTTRTTTTRTDLKEATSKESLDLSTGNSIGTSRRMEVPTERTSEKEAKEDLFREGTWATKVATLMEATKGVTKVETRVVTREGTTMEGAGTDLPSTSKTRTTKVAGAIKETMEKSERASTKDKVREAGSITTMTEELEEATTFQEEAMEVTETTSSREVTPRETLMEDTTMPRALKRRSREGEPLRSRRTREEGRRHHPEERETRKTP
jgi:hypothetical protein